MDILSGERAINPTVFAMPQMILVIMAILSIARLLTRGKEVGVRKVSGAARKQIFTQFITEAILVSLLSLLLSSVLLLLFQHLFNGLWLNRFMNISFRYTPQLFLLFLAFSIAVGFVAGLLPSIYISFFNPIHILKGMNSLKAFKRLTLRKVLLVVQFCVSLNYVCRRINQSLE